MTKQFGQVVARLHRSLLSLRDSPQTVELAYSLQMDVLREVLLVEQILQKGSVASSTEKRCRFELFVLKSFVDAIAVTYISKWNLKQLSYDIETYQPRPSPGFISGKAGNQLELEILNYLRQKSVPAILTDLSNNIRYGDICILTGPDPRLIECKQGKHANQRARRQKERVAKLVSFYVNDSKPLDFGLREARRQAFTIPEVEYSATMNAIADEATMNGQCMQAVEPGLFYCAFTPKAKESLRFPKARKVLAYYLNYYKNGLDWLSYVPFVLSITSTDRLIDFISDRLHIVVVVDLSAVRASALRFGLTFRLARDPDYPLAFYRIPKGTKTADGMFALSTHMLNRVGLECVSMKWLIEASMLEILGDSVANSTA